MKSMMNTSVDPCDDFYEYVCGNYNFQEITLAEEYLRRDLEKLEKFLENFEGETSNQKVAISMLQKCVDDKTADVNSFMNDFWSDPTTDLTKFILEVTKINPRIGGIFTIDQWPAEIDGKKYLKTILNPTADVSYVNVTLIPWKEMANKIHFMNLTEYVYQLLPEESRSRDALDNALFVREQFVELDEYVKKTGIETIKKHLRETWKSSLSKYIISSHTFKDCYRTFVDGLFSGTLGMIFLKHINFTQENIERAKMMYELVQLEGVDIIVNNHWMNPDVKKQLIEKIIQTPMHLGIPENHSNQTVMDLMYKRVLKSPNFEGSSYLPLLRDVMRMNSEETFLQFSKRASITYASNIIGLGANYNPISFAITVSQFWMKYPYSDANLPHWSLIASYAFVVAHELGHMFDRGSILMNSHIQSIQDESFKNGYLSLDKCLVEQYSNFTFPGTNETLNGGLTITENFPDILGSKIAYKLFNKYLSSDNHLLSLPGFENYTIQQQYFLRNAHDWCRKYMTKEQIEDSRSDKHSPGQFRVRGMTMNSPYFGETFGCSVGSPMNPQYKCETF